MADQINQANVMDYLLQEANKRRTYADKLRDNRAAYSNIGKIAADRFATPSEIPVNPADTYNARNRFYGAIESAVAPIREAESSYGDILTKIYELSQADKKIQEQTGTTLEDLIKKKNDLAEAGYDTSAIDKELEAMGLKKTGTKPEDVFKKVSGLAAGQQKDISDLTSAVEEISRLKKGFEELKSPTSGLQSLITGTTGPLATTVGELGTTDRAAQLRSDLDTFKDKIRKDLFGSAFTETEKKSANLPGSARQEAKNQKIIESFYNQKLNELKIKLRNAGFSQEEVDSYVANISGSDNSTSQVTMLSPDGREYTVDQSEVADAEKNGWRRK